MATGLQGVLDSFASVTSDLTSLEVITLRGSVSGVVQSDLEWSALLAKATANNGVIKLSLATRIEFDGDTKTFIADDLPPQWIVDAHNAAVTSGLAARKAIVDLALSALKKI
ncbi:MAG TPA: hypothetical protein VIM44_02470 [Rariglobus sp.]